MAKSDRQRNLQDKVYPYYFDQRHTINAFVIYSVKEKKRKWFVPSSYSIQFRFTTGSPYTPITGVDAIAGKYQLVTGAINSAINPNYNTLSAKIQWQRVFGKRNRHLLQYYLDLWNITSQKNIINRVYNVNSTGTFAVKTGYSVPFVFNIGFKMCFNTQH